MEIERMPNVYKKFVEDIGYCELCGSKRNLELHHIVPLVVAKCLDDFDLDIEDNYICVCHRCHALLTPRSILSKLGLYAVNNNKKIKFYSILNEQCEEGFINAESVLDAYQEVYDKELWDKENKVGKAKLITINNYIKEREIINE